MGKVAAEKGHKTAVTLTWKYAAGEQSTGGFKEMFEKGGGKVVKEMTLPFPNVEFQPFLTEIASLKPDVVLFGEMLLFIVLLAVGYVYVWKKRAFDWD